MKRRWFGGLIVSAAMAGAIAACTADAENTSSPVTGGEGGIDEDGEWDGSTPPQFGSAEAGEASTPKRCSGVTPPPEAVAMVQGVTRPTAAGGTIAVGKYHLTKVEAFAPASPTAGAIREALFVHTNSSAIGTVFIYEFATVVDDGAAVTSRGILEFDGPKFSTTDHCPVFKPPTRERSYTATATEIVLIDGDNVRTYTRVP